MKLPARCALLCAALICALPALLPVAPALAGKKRATNLRTVQAPSIAVQNVSGPLVKPPPYREGELIVRFKRGTSESARSATHGRRGAKLVKKLLLPDTEVVSIDASRNEKSVARAYGREATVEYAEPNFVYAITNIYPVADGLSQQWGLQNFGQEVNGGAGLADADIDAPEAWSKTTGSYNVTVGVVDSGVQYNDSSLLPNKWSNLPEAAGSTAVDDDRNSIVDDLSGYDFVAPDTDPSDENGHGTAMAGLIGIRGVAGDPISGVSQQVRLAPLRACDASGLCELDDVANAFAYAGNAGMQVVSASLSGPDTSVTLETSVTAYPQTLFVTSAGNGGGDYASDNVDSGGVGAAEYPCNITAANLICVAATDQNDELAGFSNYGATSVDLAAPGVNVLSTWPGDKISFQNGTSPATAITSGAAALVWSRKLSQTALQVKSRLINSADHVPSLLSRVFSGGRLNVRGALPPVETSSVGTSDTTFDNDGQLTTSFLGNEKANDVAIQSDGKIVAVGRTDSGGPSDVAVARYNAGDGSLDTSFDADGPGGAAGTGKVTTDFDGLADEARGVAIDPNDGRIVVVGKSGGRAVAARYNPNGTLDLSFATAGKFTVDASAGGDVGEAVAIQNDSKLVPMGSIDVGGAAPNFAVGRLTATGAPDSSFNGGALATPDFNGGTDVGLDVKLEFGGKVVVSGTSNGDFALARFNTDGTLDTSFDGDGKLTSAIGGGLEEARGLAVEPMPSGDILVTGRSYSGDNGRIAFHAHISGNTDDEIFTIDPSVGVGSLAQLTVNTAEDTAADWSPDGTKIVFSRDCGASCQNLWTMNADGTGQAELTSLTSLRNRSPNWSPDGTKIAYQSNDGTDWDIYVANANGTGQTNLTNSSGVDDEDPVWSPDGRRIAFYSDTIGGNNHEIWTMNANGTGAAAFTSTSPPVFNRGPDWSPDGTKLAWHSTSDGDEEVYTKNADGTGSISQLTSVAGNDREPGWAPSGTQMSFDTNREPGGVVDIWKMDADGNNQVKVIDGPAADPDWQPVGTFPLLRFNSNGSLDTGFSGDGKQTTEFAGGAEAGDLAVKTNPLLSFDKIIIAGKQLETAPSTYNWAVARYNADGGLDPTFGTGGKTSVNALVDGELNGVAIQADGNVVSAGYEADSNDFALLRHIGGRVSADANPTSGLDEAGQTIAVNGAGFEPSASYQIDQCRPGLCASQTSGTTSGTGTFGTTVNVDRTLDDTASTCPDPDCYLRVVQDLQELIRVPISFGSATSTRVSPSGGLIEHNQFIPVGQPFTLSATVNGNATSGSPAGSVNFDLCGPAVSPSTCTNGAGADEGTKVLVAGANNTSSATTDPITISTPGRYCPLARYSGFGSTYRASSDAAKTSCISIRQPNAALQATDDYYRTPNNVNVVAGPGSGLFQNDVWPEGLIVGEPCNDPGHICAVIDQNPLHAPPPTLNADGSFTYDPDAGYAGPDDFSYIIQQGGGGGQSLTGTVKIDVSATADMLDGTRFRGTRFRGTRFRETELVTAVTYSQCRARFVWLNPQITIPESVTLQVSAALYDAAGNRIAATDGYLANDPFYGDPFQPTVLTHLVWSQPVPSDGAFAEVYIVVEPGTVDEYEVTSSVLCGT